MKKIEISARLNGVSESATLKLNAAVQAMKARGEDVVNLTAGEPDFNVPEPAKAALRKAVDENKSKYTPVPGIPELREAVAAKTNAQQPSVAATAPWKASDVVVSNGGKQTLYDAMMALLNPGDEVIVPAPYWLSYPEMAKLAGGKPVVVQTTFEGSFKLTPAALRAALTPRSKILMINSPSNPTGAMYTREEFAALGRVLEEDPNGQGVVVFSDEIYDRIALGDEPFVSFLEACPGLRSRVVTVNGMSKSAAMTGWRIGWSVAEPWLTQAIQTIQGQSTSGINALAQYASVAALKMPEADFAEWIEKYRARRDLALGILAKAGKLKVFPPDGAFYVFIGIGEYRHAGEDSIAFCEAALKESGVALVPGGPFGSEDSIRISFATDEKSLQKGCERFVEFLKRRES